MNDSTLPLLEQWLKVLIVSYQINPSASVAQCIVYYIERILQHEDCPKAYGQQCHYFSMKKFWYWQAKQG